MGDTQTTPQERVEERDRIRAELASLMKAVDERPGGQFTDAEQKRAGELSAQFKTVNAEVERDESFRKTHDEVAGFLDANPDPDEDNEAPVGAGGKALVVDAQRGRSPGFGVRSTPTAASRNTLGQAIASAVFGPNPNLRGNDRPDWYKQRQARMTTGARDVPSTNFDGTPGTTPSRSPYGKAVVNAIPTAQRPDGGTTMLLAEPAIQIAPLCTEAELGSGYRYDVVRQNGTPGHTDAAWVQHLSRKPSSAFQYERLQEEVGTCAVLSDPVAQQDIQDIPGLDLDLSMWLAYQVARKVDQTILLGDADTATAEPSGILNTEGVHDQVFATSALVTIRKSITTLEVEGVVPNGIVMDPATWEAVELSTDSSGKPLFPQYQDAVDRRLFGFPVVVSDLCPAGTAVVGNWRAIALALRTSMDVSWTDAGAATVGGSSVDLYEHNAVRFRAEQRLGITVIQPSFFVVCHTVEAEEPVEP